VFNPFDCESIVKSGIVEWYEPIRLLKYDLKYIRSNLLSVFTNRSGRYYWGQDGVFLEGSYATTLNPDRFNGDVYMGSITDNSGRVKIYVGNQYIQNTRFGILSEEFRGGFDSLNLKASVACDTGYDKVPFKFEIMLMANTDSGTRLWTLYKEKDEWVWKTDASINEDIISGQIDYDIETPPSPDTSITDWYINVDIIGNLLDNLEAVWLWDTKITANYSDWDSIDYSQKLNNRFNEQAKLKHSFDVSFGITHEGFNNDRMFHISALYDNNGDVIEKIGYKGINNFKKPLDYTTIYYNTISNKSQSIYKMHLINKLVSPFSIVYYDDMAYSMVDYKLHLQDNWSETTFMLDRTINIDLIYKLCDFSVVDFDSSDFCCYTITT
jgi:hypothetical protein